MTPSPLTLHILLALAVGEMSAQGVAEQIALDSQGTMLVKNSPLYKALHRLHSEGRIEPAGLSGRWRLTARGRQSLKGERVRLLMAASLLRIRV